MVLAHLEENPSIRAIATEIGLSNSIFLLGYTECNLALH